MPNKPLSSAITAFLAHSFQEDSFMNTNYTSRDNITRIVLGFRITDYDWAVKLAEALNIVGVEEPVRKNFQYIFSIRVIGM